MVQDDLLELDPGDRVPGGGHGLAEESESRCDGPGRVVGQTAGMHDVVADGSRDVVQLVAMGDLEPLEVVGAHPHRREGSARLEAAAPDQHRRERYAVAAREPRAAAAAERWRAVE